MAESDDERDFKRRDKFHTERRGHDGGERGEGGGGWRPRGGGGFGGRGGGFGGRGGFRGGDFRDGGGFRGGDRGYSPERGGGRRHEMSPPPKRMRGGWGGGDDDRGFGGGGGYDDFDRERDYYERPPPPRHYSRPSKPKDEDMEGFQPAMMSFKSFLQTQDDQISDEEAIKKYADYKLEFKRQQLNEFFVTHKEEEWFKQKYHPDDSVKRKDELKAFLKKRVEVFQEFLDNGKIKELKLDSEKQDQLIRLLDSVVIKLEGGSDFDLTVLDLPDPEDEEKKRDDSKNNSRNDSRNDEDDKEKRDGPKDREEVVMDKAKEMLNFLDTPKPEESKKRKREDDEDGEDGEDGDKPEEEKEEENKTEVEKDMDEAEAEAEEKNKEDEGKMDDDKEKDKDAEDGEKPSDDDVDKPKPLHKTSSIFLRNLPPTVTKVEVEAMCKRYDGFLRSAIADPAPDRRWFRRGWVTFKREVKIKDICYNLNNIRLRDCELGPIVNRDLTKRVRTVAGLTQDKKVVRNDIKLAAKIITNLDNKWGLWKPEEESKDESSLGLVSANPLLNNITDYLIEEASAEEEELLGRKEGEDEDGKDEGIAIQRDEELIDVLDKMILYLRIVHSVDFYNHSEYPNEDEMPNRCGILHARGALSASKTTSSEMEEYMTTFEKKMGGFLVLRGELTNEEAAKLGLKNQEEEVEKFISANTQELGKVRFEEIFDQAHIFGMLFLLRTSGCVLCRAKSSKVPILFGSIFSESIWRKLKK